MSSHLHTILILALWVEDIALEIEEALVQLTQILESF